MHDPVNAFVNDLALPGAPAGPLAGLSLGVKDLYDIEGHVTGCGSPDWARTHGPATQTAPAVQMLLDAGARLVGKTHTDEIAYSLMGANAHYGTPINSAAPDRVPGGSSSGSAAAVAARLVDIGLGSDTGGSVRMPASFCGLWGIRPTHGLIPLDNVMPLAPSFDTAGWFTRDPMLLAKVGAALGLEQSGPLPARLLLPVDVWSAVPGAVVEALAPAVQKLQSTIIMEPCRLSDTPSTEWLEMFKVCQASEVWETHGAWVEAETPDFGPGIRERFAMAKALDPAIIKTMHAQRRVFANELRERLPEEAVMIVPSAPGPAPLRTAEESELDGFRMAALKILCPAGLAGLPQLSMPLAQIEGAPLGLSLIGAAGSEGTLFEMALAAKP
ncbi:MAG: amidase [Pseudomonadota bacterium]